VAIKPSRMALPFTIPNSRRLLDPTGMAMFAPVAPPPGIPAVAQTANVMTNFGWEYVWHCHLLGHEENDMMRPMVLNVAPAAPSFLGATAVKTTNKSKDNVILTWVDNSDNESGFTLQRATNVTFTAGLNTTAVAAAAGTGSTVTITQTGLPALTIYYYRVQATNAVGSSAWVNATPFPITTP